ncbi:succinate-semialdehyde dehydrogenase/glutarate-semialdehyde dehydrogenase [Rhodococcus sp. 27YEA15]|uniref:NAD-dependent succinate-semialdehyde dehydrogenase n=1 Tax=Rhodococcus sp. 27YEA15 TaxID=3156259 RepID=UPI003C7DD481
MSGQTYQVIDPSTGEVVETFEHTSDAEIQRAITASAVAYASWKDMPITDRAVVVRRIGDLFVERAVDLATIMSQEMGKSVAEGMEEIEFCRAIFEYYATEGPALAADQEIQTTSGGHAVVRKLPVGPLLGIMPWNFPYYQVARFVAPNLMLGNTILLKHAASVPRSALAIAEIISDAGVPLGAYENVFATHAQLETIIADPRVQGISLTGSERAGSIVAALAGKHLKKCVLELGGSDPMVVLDTDNLDDLVDKAWSFRMYNSGQVCNSNKRMIVMSDLFDDFVAKLADKALAVENFSPMSSRAAAESLSALVDDAVSKGATLHAGGVLGSGPAAYYSPAVLSGVTENMRAYREELFGPVAVVYRVSSDEEALDLANDTPYGLGGSVFSTDTDRAERVATRLDVGMSNVNTTAGEGADLPFGGVKRSGFGRELGPLGMDEFVNKRLTYIA